MTKLKRHITLLPLIFYGVGDVLGSGIYGLIGKVAGQMGNFVWLAFLAAFGVAVTTALTYAYLGSRYPRAAGSSFIVWKSTGSPAIAFLIGMATMCSGLTSMATASRIFSGYLTGLFEFIPMTAAIIGFCAALTAIVYSGIRQSLWVNTLCTVIELTGLLVVIVAGIPFLGSVNLFDAASIPQTHALSPGLVFSGAVLAFYSFIGFEDVLNVSEEVVKPERNIPMALLISMFVSSVVYMLISVVAVSVIPAADLAASNQPLVDVVIKAWPGFPAQIFSVIALFAVANTALLNYLMASRLVYGLSDMGLLPKFFSKVHKSTKTPYTAVIAVSLVLIILALIGEVGTLARATSLLVLIVFFSMNASLIVFMRREGRSRGRKIPYILPAIGAGGALIMATHARAGDYKIAGAMLLIISILYWFKRPTPAQIAAFERKAEEA